MEQEADNVDPEAGPESGSPCITTASHEEIPVKNPSAESHLEPLIPLTHTPPSQSLEEGNSSSSSVNKPPVLIHRFLLKIPMQIRYSVYGVLSSALFVLLYNSAVTRLSHLYVPSTIYAATYLMFIPIQHAMAACMVFGWPDRYLQSLTANTPIGLTAIALGSYLTAYLDRVDFNQSVEEFLRSLGLLSPTTADNKNAENNEFYTSFVVLVVTSLWSFILSVLVNSPSEATEKKEL